jgi:hypothetical protein
MLLEFGAPITMHLNGTHSRATSRPKLSEDHIRISFQRFLCLRSMAYAAQIKDYTRLQELLKELASIESKEMAGLLQEGRISEAKRNKGEKNSTLVGNIHFDTYYAIDHNA